MPSRNDVDHPTIDYYFSFLSLWSYVGSLVFQSIVARHQARVIYKPIDLLAVFAASGGKPVKERPAVRRSYRLVEMERWRRLRDIPLKTNPRFYPVDPSLAHRVLLGALEDERDVAAFVHASLKAVWADDLDIADTETIVRLADQSGLDGPGLLARANDVALCQREKDLTEEAVARQVFGAPFYFFRDEPFWGQDRLDLLELSIADPREPILSPRL